MVYGIQIYKSFGGRSARLNWSNTYHINSNLPLNSQILRDSVQEIVEAERTAHYDAVHFMRAHVRAVRNDIFNGPTNDFVTVELDQVGARTLTGELLPMELALLVKRDTETGRAGSILYRGCLANTDISNSADNTFLLATPATFNGTGENSNTLVDLLNGGIEAGNFVLPVAGANPLNLYRSVIRHRLGGVQIVQATRRRVTVETAVEKAAQRKANALVRTAWKAIGDNAVGAVSGDLKALLYTLVDAFIILRNSLPVEARAKFQLPFPLNALPPADA